MRVAEDIDVLKAVCFDDVTVSNRHGLFQGTNGLLYRCAQVGNAGAQYVLAKIVLMSSSQLLDMENEGATLPRDHSSTCNSCCGKIRIDDALAASFMSHFAPDQGCSTIVSSQTLVHSQLVRKFLCHCSAHDLAQMHFHLQSYVDYFIKPDSRGWYLLHLIYRMCLFANHAEDVFRKELAIKRVFNLSRQGDGGLLSEHVQPSDLFAFIEYFDESKRIFFSQFEECCKNTLACFDDVFP